MSDTKPKTAAPKTAGRKVSVGSDGTIHVKNAPKQAASQPKPRSAQVGSDGTIHVKSDPKQAPSSQPTSQPQPSQDDNGGCAGCLGQLLGLFLWARIIMFVLHLLGLA